jgi:uncharacterized protein (TIGR02284 family)
MALDNTAVITILNNLIETCKDGQNGFRTAAADVNNGDLQSLFRTYAEQRARFAAELQSEVRRLGGDPERGGSLAGTLHRGWMNVKSTVTGGDESAIIAEAERGEDSACKNYEEALAKALPADVQALIQRQFAGVKEAHDRIRALEVATSAH